MTLFEDKTILWSNFAIGLILIIVAAVFIWPVFFGKTYPVAAQGLWILSATFFALGMIFLVKTYYRIQVTESSFQTQKGFSRTQIPYNTLKDVLVLDTSKIQIYYRRRRRSATVMLPNNILAVPAWFEDELPWTGQAQNYLVFVFEKSSKNPFILAHPRAEEIRNIIKPHLT